MGHVFPEPRYAVPGVLAEGANLLAGAPKLGKSWFALNVAASIAYGGLALDKISVEKGEALYLALEDPPRRLQRRLRLILGGEPAPDGLFLETVWPRLLEGGCDELDAWLGAHPDCRLVVVDVFAQVRGVAAGNVNRYEADYAAMASVKSVADAHGVASLVVHHTRKADADDFVDSVSGTRGLAAAADAVLVLTRSRGSVDAKLEITGRDIEEAEYAMQFNAAEGSWALLEGPAAEYELGTTRRSILAHVRENGAATPKVIADALQIEYETVKKTCQRMAVTSSLAPTAAGLTTTCPPCPLCPPTRKTLQISGPRVRSVRDSRDMRDRGQSTRTKSTDSPTWRGKCRKSRRERAPSLTARQVGELLGLSASTILDRFERGELPGFRVGARVGSPVRFRWSEVEAWLEQGRCGPTPSLQPGRVP